MDPILETIWTFVQTIMSNPVAAGAIYGVIRNLTGFLQKKYKEGTGQDYDPKVLGADILKYEVAVNSIFASLPPETAGKVAPLVMIADIVFSAAKKLKNGASIPVTVIPTPPVQVPPEPISVTPPVETTILPPIPVIVLPVVKYGPWIQSIMEHTGQIFWFRNISYDGGKTFTQQEYSKTNPNPETSPILIPPIAVPSEPVITYGTWTTCEDATGKPMWVRAIYTDGIKLKGTKGWQYSTTNPAVVVTSP
jgi:hypothetical protein